MFLELNVCLLQVENIIPELWGKSKDAKILEILRNVSWGIEESQILGASCLLVTQKLL